MLVSLNLSITWKDQNETRNDASSVNLKEAASGGAAHSTENQAKRYLQIPANVVSHWFTSKRTKITNMLLLVHSVSSILHGKKEKEGWGVGGFRRKTVRSRCVRRRWRGRVGIHVERSVNNELKHMRGVVGLPSLACVDDVLVQRSILE